MQNNTQTCEDVIFHVFDSVIIQLSIDRSNVQHLKLCLKLVKPQVKVLFYIHKDGVVSVSEGMSNFDARP